MPVTYSSYLKIDELLNLQECQSEGPKHDEMLFILIHQIYELWFKEILHELDFLTQMLRKNEHTRAQHTLNRVLKIFKTLVVAPNSVSWENSDGSPEFRFGGNFKETLR